MESIPHGPWSLIFDFLVSTDVDALPLFHTSKKFSELVSERMKQRSPYPRRLFYNLKILDIRVLSVQSLQWFLSQGLDLSSFLSIQTCRLGNLEAVKWLHDEAGCEWDSDAIASAARGGHLENVKWLRANGCEWDSDAIASDARGGHLEVVKWLHDEASCEWDSDAIASQPEEVI